MEKLTAAIMTILDNTRKTPFLVGKHGIGKTDYVRQLAEKLGKKMIVLNLASIESSDFLGLPYIENGKTKNARPNFFDYDLIFLDEVDRVRDPSVKAVLNSFLWDKELGDHKLNAGTVVLAAGNYDPDNYDTVTFDDSLKDRFAFFDFKISIPDRLDFFKNKLGKENVFVQFLESKPELFSELSPRTLFSAAQVSTNDLALESLIGRELSRVFENFKQSGLVSLESILANSIDFLSLSSMTRVSLVNAAVNSFLDLKNESMGRISHLNDFINELSAEEKSLYFSKIKNELIRGKLEKLDLEKLNELGLFKGQKIYLKELV